MYGQIMSQYSIDGNAKTQISMQNLLEGLYMLKEQGSQQIKCIQKL